MLHPPTERSYCDSRNALVPLLWVCLCCEAPKEQWSPAQASAPRACRHPMQPFRPQSCHLWTENELWAAEMNFESLGFLRKGDAAYLLRLAARVTAEENSLGSDKVQRRNQSGAATGAYQKKTNERPRKITQTSWTPRSTSMIRRVCRHCPLYPYLYPAASCHLDRSGRAWTASLLVMPNENLQAKHAEIRLGRNVVQASLKAHTTLG